MLVEFTRIVWSGGEDNELVEGPRVSVNPVYVVYVFQIEGDSGHTGINTVANTATAGVEEIRVAEDYKTVLRRLKEASPDDLREKVDMLIRYVGSEDDSVAADRIRDMAKGLEGANEIFEEDSPSN